MKNLCICFLSFVLCACSSNKNTLELIKEYNSIIDNLLASDGFIMNVEASYQTKIVDETHLKDELTDVDSNLQQDNELKIDLSEDKPNYSLNTVLHSSKNNDTQESTIVSKYDKTITYIKVNDTYIKDLEANNEVDIIESIKKILFYIDNDSKENIIVSKKDSGKDIIYNITLATANKTVNDISLLDLNYEIIVNKGCIEQIKGSYKSYIKNNDKFQRIDYQCVITIENNKIPQIDFLEE